MGSSATQGFVIAATCGVLLGCESLGIGATPGESSPLESADEAACENVVDAGELFPSIEAEVYQRAYRARDAERARKLERLRTDLALAESALIEADSGLRGEESRADAVSALAEVWVLVERVAGAVPWAADHSEVARAKLAEAERQIDAGRFSSALYLVERGRRIARRLIADADAFEGPPKPLYVRPARVNMRSTPSTDSEVLTVLTAGMPVYVEMDEDPWALVRTLDASVGWVHRSLLAAERPIAE